MFIPNMMVYVVYGVESSVILAPKFAMYST
jgi:hypothetical protein